MGSNHSATTSPIPVYGPNNNQGRQVYPGPPAIQYRASPYYQGPNPQYGGPGIQVGPGPRSRGPPRCGPRGPPQQGSPFGPYANPAIPPASGKPNIFSRNNRPTVEQVMDYADSEFAFEDEAEIFRSAPKKNPPFGDFDPFAKYNARNGGGGGPIEPREANRYYRSPPSNPPASKTYHFQPPPNGAVPEHVFHYDPSTGDLAFPSGHQLPVVSGGYVPPGFGTPSGNPNGGIVFPPQGQVYGQQYY